MRSLTNSVNKKWSYSKWNYNRWDYNKWDYNKWRPRKNGVSVKLNGNTHCVLPSKSSSCKKSVVWTKHRELANAQYSTPELTQVA